MEKWKKATVILSAVCLILLAGVIYLVMDNSSRAGAAGAIKTVDVNEIKFNALVVTYVQIDDKGGQKLQARMDYEYFQSDGTPLKNASSEMVLLPQDITTLTTFINSKMGVIRAQEVASPGKLYTAPITVAPILER